jgi:hypothetical protein
VAFRHFRYLIIAILYRASAYGIDPLVAKLVECGADVNATNSFGFSCILEACHRGFADIVRSLLKGPVDLSYIPNQKEAAESPFASAPCQSALGEAGRCGFYKIVQVGIPKSCSWCLYLSDIVSLDAN